MEASQNDALHGTNANGGNGRDHGHSGPISQIGKTHLLSGVKETPMVELEGHATETQAAIHGDEAGEGDEVPRPKLPKGFYEVEAIRSKRVRMGRTQYLIKWLGWPEADNTWEPLKNLRGVRDLIDSFEDSIKSTKRSKQVAHNTQTKHQSTSVAVVDHDDIATLPQAVAFDGDEDNNGDASSRIKEKQPMENGSTSAAGQTADRMEEDNYDPKLIDLNATLSTTSSGVDVDGLVVHAQSTKNPCSNCHVDSPSLVYYRELVLNERPRGARRRKLGQVKRFTKEPHESETVEQADAAVAGIGEENGNINQVNVYDDKLDVVEIIKLLHYFSSNATTTKEHSITFLASRSDGTETLVSNKYLKNSNSKWLFKYYEQCSLTGG